MLYGGEELQTLRAVAWSVLALRSGKNVQVEGMNRPTSAGDVVDRWTVAPTSDPPLGKVYLVRLFVSTEKTRNDNRGLAIERELISVDHARSP